MKSCIQILLYFSMFAAGSTAMASAISPSTVAGRYDVKASAFFQKVHIDFKVLNDKEFEIYQYDRSGLAEETCNGTYSMIVTPNTRLGPGGVTTLLKGIFNCPSNRSKMIDFNLDFQNKTFEDLVTGTSVVITTSMVPMKIKAAVKKIAL